MFTRIKIFILIGFVLRTGISLWNAYWGPSFGAETDAAGFHLAAIAYSKNPVLHEFIIGHIYSYILGIVYFFTVDSLFLGGFLSVLAWAASALILAKIMRVLSLDKADRYKVMSIYTLLPSSVLYTGVTLREPYQLFFVNLAIYASLNIFLKRSTRYWVVLCLAAIGMAVLHGGLFAFGAFIIVSTLFLLIFRGHKGLSLGKLMLVAPLAILFVIYSSSLFNAISYNLDGGVGQAVESYQQGALNSDGRTDYKKTVEIAGASDLLLFVPFSLLQYLFEPMPWRVSSIVDIVPIFENMIRVWLIWRAIICLRDIPIQRRRPILFLFISYLICELIWSLGTINWGTAIRHHIPSFGVLLVAAFACSRKRQQAKIMRKTYTPRSTQVRLNTETTAIGSK